MQSQLYLTVHEFAQAVNRFPNYIYKLTKEGNRYRKLKSRKLAGKLMIPSSEIDEYPFTPSQKVLLDYNRKIKKLMRSEHDLLEEVKRLKAKEKK